MNTGVTIGVVVAVISILVTLFLYTNDQVDKKIQKAMVNPEVLSQLAKQAQLPFVIIDENGVYRYEHNTRDLIEDITIELGREGAIGKITIVPKEMLAAPPIVETLNFEFAFSEPEMKKPYSWVFKPAQEEYIQILARASDLTSIEKAARQFKITFITKK